MLPTTWPEYLFKGNAVSWIQNKALRYCKGKGIDIGGGRWTLPGAVPIDLTTEMQVCDFEDLSLDYVFSSHTLEHIENWRVVLSSWCAKVKPNGYLFLYLPHEKSPWRGSRAHRWQPTPSLIVEALREIGMAIVECTTKPDSYCSFMCIAVNAKEYEPSNS